MHGPILQLLKYHITELEEELKASEEQWKIFKHINKGFLVYAEALYIHAARDGVEEYLFSRRPAILQYCDWTLCDEGFALNFNVVASQDPEPYNPPYNPVYSGFSAQIRGPKYYYAESIKIVPIKELPLYVSYAHTTPLLSKLLKGTP